MRLSKLHISGFKSFPDRAELGFDIGVTAIVGPNGCGKSNVVDAITWVLGEQSAKSLRGERMEDVIFNGSDARKPTATAEVRLKLSEVAQAAAMVVDVVDPLLDAQPIMTRDVEIGRRLYRSGESEYLIDGEVCRLRDIQDVLMDSGLGVKAYAVIEQGKIGQILASRPAERRALIEEAAGVTKYKSRRRSAELKLEAAQQNLTRIDDIVFEVEKQRGALRRQAARARRYKRLREELRRWEQVQFAQRHGALSRDIEAAAARLEDARGREAAAAAHVAELEATLERVRLGLTESESGATTARERAHARELEIGRRQQQILFDRQQIEALGVQQQALSAEASDLEERREPARLAIAEQQEAARRARQALEEAGHSVTACQDAYTAAYARVQAAEHDADDTRAAVLAANTRVSALRQARDNAAAMRDRFAADRQRLEVEARDLQAEADRAAADREAATRSLESVRTALEGAIRVREQAERDAVARREDRARIAQSLLARERELAGTSARLRSLEQLEASRATYGDAARFLLAEAGAAVAQHGAVADYLEVEPSFERAVDALLGNLLQHVIVGTADDAGRALTLAAERNAGRCGLVILEDISPRARDEFHADVMAGARTLRTVVRTTGPNAEALSSLIGDALIVDSFAAARDLARRVTVPVATRAGEVCREAGLVEGGSRREARGILETRGEIRAMREQLAAATEQIAALRVESTAIDAAIAAVDAAVSAHRQDQHAHEKAIVGFNAQVARGTEETTRVARRQDVVATERRRAEEEELSAERRREESAAAITVQESDQRDAEASLASVMAGLQASREAAEGRSRELSTARAEQAGLVERASALDLDVVRLTAASSELEARIVGRRGEISRSEERREQLRVAVSDNEHQLDDDVRGLDTLKDEVRRLDEVLAGLRSDFSTREQAIRVARQGLETIRASVLQFEVARATAAANLTHLSAACLESVGAAIEDVVAAVARMEADGELAMPAKRLAAVERADADEGDDEDSVDGDAPTMASAEAIAAGLDPSDGSDNSDDDASVRMSAEEVIADLRRKIDKLGPVNMMAIEQFDELETRHAFLTTQRKDLLDSIEQTGEAIRKIDKTTRERFEEAFVSINKFFESTFTAVFGGGRAGLVLIDQDNDPESGIDIIAQPPGKRLQNVQLLSGGEKALTAMALMFAVFKYRPSPFCLLDEIDAPLDDANIGRFVEMLRGMQDHTQFILITHNRKTMEIANRLYGVTMEEPGVSKLISVQLN